jgi:HPt (histidine-containing phosphotransfer) domain-containing protein
MKPKDAAFGPGAIVVASLGRVKRGSSAVCDLLEAAHGLKGAAGNLSASGVADAASALERMAADNRLDDALAGYRRLSTEMNLLTEALKRLEEVSAPTP